MTDDLSNIYEEAEKYIHQAIFRWKQHLPSLWEDAFQEGMIQVWRDVDAGETVKLKILRRASLVANKYFHRNGEYSFGKPAKSREGIASKPETREKVQSYLDETMPVTGKWPTAVEVAKATGLKPGNVTRILRSIREGRVDHMVYRPDGRKDWDHYRVYSTESLNTSMGEGLENSRSWTDNPLIAQYAEEFEDNIVSNMDFVNLLSKLNEHHRGVLYLYFVESRSAVEIAQHFGIEGSNPSATASRHIQKAINQARMVLDPYEGECIHHHVRTPETTEVRVRKDGVRFRVCRVCQKDNTHTGGGKKTPVNPGARIGRPPAPDCPYGHGPKTYRDARGTMRCHTCKNEQARKSLQKKAKQKRENS